MKTPEDRLEELLDATTGMAARQLFPHEIAQIWTDQHRILFCTADGQSADGGVDDAQNTRGES